MKKTIFILILMSISSGIYAQHNYDNQNTIYSNSGNVGIGTQTPSNSQGWHRVLDVAGSQHSKILATSVNKKYKTGIFSHNESWYGGGGFVGTESNHNLHLITNYASKMTILTNGNVGIGTQNPSNAQGWNRVLDVAGSQHSKILATSVNEKYKTGIFSHNESWYGGGGFVGTESNHNLHLITNYASKMTILTNGNVGIGTQNPDSKLTVKGNIHSREIKVTATAGGADFVFANEYQLPSLAEVEAFVKKNKHLPEIASAKEMEKNGIHLAEMNIKLLQKIEELTLYVIEQNKRISLLESKSTKK
ncbi:tail fiber protein [Aquimarina sp. AU58]|uniref:tail fiber protein n=1 Tax=Aquimarina sp. AU58 TaxID=1874112 RepID=UPI00135AF151|nr:tail fiber protein [Aquimarina sp. AU58]